jgi:dienelactone hydrolase
MTNIFRDDVPAGRSSIKIRWFVILFLTFLYCFVPFGYGAANFSLFRTNGITGRYNEASRRRQQVAGAKVIAPGSDSTSDSPAHLEISPERVLEGDPVSVRIVGLRPGALATIHAQSAQGASIGGTPFYAEATFMADENGMVDLATTAPVRGYYHGADLHGLFWSQRLLARDPAGQAAIKTLRLDEPKSIDTNLEILTLEEGGTVDDRKVLILVPSYPGIVGQEVRADGLVGTFYSEKGATKCPVIVILGGSEGGFTFANLFGAKLASRGYAVLGLAYFAPAENPIEGLPRALNQIPIELLEKARNWLKTRPEADITRFGIVGGSKGGELTLVLAANYDWITAAVSYVPYDLVRQGFGYGVSEQSMGSSWTRAGLDLPFVPETGQREEIMRGRQPGAPQIELARVTKANIAAASPELIAAATIPVERSHAALLMIGGGDDRTGDSGAGVERAVARLKRARYQYPYEALIYPDAGHGIVGTGWRPTTTHNVGPFNDGGNAEADGRAQADSWTKMLEFLKRELRP